MLTGWKYRTLDSAQTKKKTKKTSKRFSLLFHLRALWQNSCKMAQTSEKKISFQLKRFDPCPMFISHRNWVEHRKKKETKYAEKVWKVEQANKMADVREGSKGLGGPWGEKLWGCEFFLTWSLPNLIWALYCWPKGDYCHPHGTVNAVEVLDSCSADAYFTLHTQSLQRATQNDRNVSPLILSADRYTFFLTEFPDSTSQNSVCFVSVMDKMHGQKMDQISNSITLKWGEYSEFNLSVWWVQPPHFLMSL